MNKIVVFAVSVATMILVCSSCMAPKLSIPINDVDSVIRIVNPDHNCGCDYKGKTLKLPQPNKGKRNVYYWQTVYIKNYAGADLLQQAQKTKSELVRLIPELNYYRRIYLEFREPQVNNIDTIFRSDNIGVAYFLKDKCHGYKAATTAKQLIKKSHNKRFEASLCK
jgi:putative hemolysin